MLLFFELLHMHPSFEFCWTNILEWYTKWLMLLWECNIMPKESCDVSNFFCQEARHSGKTEKSCSRYRSINRRAIMKDWWRSWSKHPRVAILTVHSCCTLAHHSSTCRHNLESQVVILTTTSPIQTLLIWAFGRWY